MHESCAIGDRLARNQLMGIQVIIPKLAAPDREQSVVCGIKRGRLYCTSGQSLRIKQVVGLCW